MKRNALILLLTLSLLLSGCSSLLARNYSYITPHNTTLPADGDPSTLRAESYQELVNALIYFITQGVETGTVRLYIDSESAEGDLERACLEVVQESPLGSYAVEFIKYSVNFVVTYYEADVQITYRRTREQINSIVSVTGTTAIRSELTSALATFAPEQALRIGYFDGTQGDILALVEEAYYANPDTALGMPEVEIFIYPDTGRQRIVEILLHYATPQQELTQQRNLLAVQKEQLLDVLRPVPAEQRIRKTAQTILTAGGYVPNGGTTAYHALLTGGANEQGLALAMSLLCQGLELPCRVVIGTRNDEPHMWNVVDTPLGWRHLDLTVFSTQEEPFGTDEQLDADGYQWDRDLIPPCLAAEELSSTH